MQYLGRVLHVSSSRNLILKAKTMPKIGADVADENLKSVGTVFDVFGPVHAPYVAVKPRTIEPQRLINHLLYTVIINEKRKRKHGR